MNFKYFVLMLGLLSFNAAANDSNLDAAIGGAIGGATGAVIGNELGGRDGAIIGGAVGAAIGTTVTTDQHQHVEPRRDYHYDAAPRRIVPQYEYHSPRTGNTGYHCPPGQAKKGRC